MKRVPLGNLPMAASSRRYILENLDIAGAILASTAAGKCIAVYGPRLASKTLQDVVRLYPNATLHWERPAQHIELATKSRTAQALRLLDDGLAENPFDAAGRAKIDVAAVYRALAEREARGVCPCCTQLLPKVKG